MYQKPGKTQFHIKGGTYAGVRIYQDIKEQRIKQGLEQGVQQGQAILVLCQLKRRIGEIESNDEIRINGLSVEQLEALESTAKSTN